MAMNDPDEDLNSRAKRRAVSEPSADSGKSFRFALIMVGACVVVSLVVGRLLPELAPAPAKVSLTAAAVTPPARGAPKTVANKISYPADPSGHFFVDAMVNGVEIRFLVDTGATFVALSPDDAAAAGIAPQNLSFDEATNTANGVSHVARTSLRSIRLGQLEITDVAAVVVEQSMPVSLLGMSFLNRVDGYSIRDGVLTIEW
ncbi:MAG TPA: TIGR02281 family clan AA aspartic protease [Stellaceae bacterium]|jgi:aspartyl protease family protein|nr:TIGR02281 family clan AA aspartic protease [Stellaceae bacterium]